MKPHRMAHLPLIERFAGRRTSWSIVRGTELPRQHRVGYLLKMVQRRYYKTVVQRREHLAAEQFAGAYLSHWEERAMPYDRPIQRGVDSRYWVIFDRRSDSPGQRRAAWRYPNSYHFQKVPCR